jgi:cellulose synthase/poly-beta-1,6-N-acetylglucosamine synthase-like glycosyltransferase
MKTCIYTVITGNYDRPIELPPLKGIDAYLFTDNPNMTSDTWKIQLLPPSDRPKHASRKVKALYMDYLPNYDLCIYIDGNMQIKGDIHRFIRTYYKGGFLTCSHPVRRTVEDEVRACEMIGKDTGESLNTTLQALKLSTGMSKTKQLYESGFIVRDYSENTQALCRTWWSMIEQGTHRDQISLPFAAFASGVYPKTVPSHIRNGLIKIHPHKKHRDGADFGIYYSNPFSIEKNIGKAYNQFCALVPNDDDWIVLQDGDILYLTPDWGKRIYDSLKKDGDKYGLVSCYTNRLSSSSQLHNGKRSNDHDVRNHDEVAHTYNTIGIKEHRATGIAGLFMAFKKSTWKKVGGFAEDNIGFDTDFSQRVRKHGMKIGLMTNLYVYHWYRGWEENNPQKSKGHLL